MFSFSSDLIDMIRFNLFARFENALVQFHEALIHASIHYRELFQALLNGDDISIHLIEDTHLYAIQQTRIALQEEQKRISRVLGGKDTLYTLSAIYERARDKLQSNIVEVGRQCIELNMDIRRHTQAIEQYFGSKVQEYKSFFERVYNDAQKSSTYNKDGEHKKNNTGVLLHTHA